MFPVSSVVVPRKVHVANVELKECEPQPDGHAIVAEIVLVHMCSRCRKCVDISSNLRAIGIFLLCSDGLPISPRQPRSAYVKNLGSGQFVAFTRPPKKPPRSGAAKERGNVMPYGLDVPLQGFAGRVAARVTPRAVRRTGSGSKRFELRLEAARGERVAAVTAIDKVHVVSVVGKHDAGQQCFA